MSVVELYRKSFKEHGWTCWAVRLTSSQCVIQRKHLKLHDKLAHFASLMRMSGNDFKAISQTNDVDDSETFYILTNNIKLIDFIRDSDEDFFFNQVDLPQGEFKAFYNVP